MLTVQGYIGWAGAKLQEAGDFSPMRDAFPELVAASRRFDAAFSSIHLGRLVVVAFKNADAMGFVDCHWHLKYLLDMVPKPGEFDAVEYYGLLVLVFEKPLDSKKRDRLLELRRRSWWHRGLVQVVLVELDAPATWSTKLPATLKSAFWPLHEAISAAGEPPPLKPSVRVAGQRLKVTAFPLATIGLITVLFAVHLLVELLGVPDSYDLRLYRFGAEQARAFVNGDWWRWVTVCFLHGGWEHIIGNVAGLYEFGRSVELLWGSGWFLGIFMATGLTGNMLSFAITRPALAVGASGAVFGLCGAVIAAYTMRKKYIALRSQAAIFKMVIIGLYLLANGFRSRGVDNMAHLGGFIGGYLLGAILPFQGERPESKAGERAGLAAAVLCAICAFNVFSSWDKGDFRFTRWVDPHMHLAMDWPDDWYRLPSRNPGQRVLANWLGGQAVFTQYAERIDGIFEEPEAQLRHMMGEMFREGYEGRRFGPYASLESRLGEVEVSRYAFSGANAVRFAFEVQEVLRYMVLFFFPTRIEATASVEYIFLPHENGFLLSMYLCPSSDTGWYKSIFDRMKRSMVISDRPIWPLTPGQPPQ